MEDSTLCVVSDCNTKRSRQHNLTGGRCSAHYAEHRKSIAPRCSMAECDKPVHCDPYCSTHYARFKTRGSAEDSALIRQMNINTGFCSVEGCDNPMRKRTWCAAHYSQWTRMGEVAPFVRKWTPKGTPCALCGDAVLEGSKGRKFCSQSCQMAASRHKNNRPTKATCVACERTFSLARRDGRLQRTDTKWCHDCRRTRAEARRYLRYGVTQVWYVEKMAQGCSICGATDRRFHVDHDHGCCPGQRSCGECVRGLLCSQCNQALGLFGDRTDILHKAIEYLK